MVDFAPLRSLRVQQVQPFTYRDGVTFLELLERLASHVKEVLEPSLKSVVDDLVEQFTIEMGEHRGSYVEGVEEFQRIHDAFMSDVNAHLIALNDGAVTDLVNDDTSLLGEALRAIFTTRESLDRDMMVVIGDQLSLVSRELDRRSAVYPRFFGAVGDGVADDTEAMLQWAVSDYTQLEPGAVYRITQGLPLEKSVDGNGATIIIAGDDTTNSMALNVTGDHRHVRDVTVRGVGYNRAGISVRGDYAQVTGCTVEHIYSEWWAYGIRVETNGGGALIANNVIHDTWAKGNNNTGDSIGASRGIYVHGDVLQSMATSMITGNVVRETRGEEGDGIQLLFRKADGTIDPFGLCNFTIANNLVEDSSRRMLKIQASGVNVINNVFKQTRHRTPEVHGIEHPSWGVGVIQSEYVRVNYNIIECVDLLGGISVSAGVGNTSARLRGNEVRSNSFTVSPSMNTMVCYFSECETIAVTDNTTMGGSIGMAFGRSGTAIVQNNVLRNLVTPNEQGLIRSIWATDDVGIAVFKNNTIVNSPDTQNGDVGNYAQQRVTVGNDTV